MFDWDAYEKRVDWFTKARFGMFIHWGLYSIPARGEWVKTQERTTTEDYQKYFDEFNPVDYDPKKWAKLAKQAGMKYAVLTSKHHDGFCLFDSKLTDYKCTNTKAGRDLVREYLEAFRAEGIKVGLYYSLIDWHHPDYPHYGDRFHPMRENEAFKDVKHNFDNYLDYMHGQVRELLTNYGKIDIMWFDFSYEKKVGEDWRATELVKMVREIQPHIILDNRLELNAEGFGSLVSGEPTAYSGDFVSPEQIIPPEGIWDANGRPVVWEANATLNNHWGYAQMDHEWKPASMIVRKLVECVSKGGNFLLNVGPDARGTIPPESVKILEKVGDWMKLNSESIYECGNAGIAKPDFGRYTRKGNKVYAHIWDMPLGLAPMHGLKKGDVLSARMLATGAELNVAGDWTSKNYNDAFVNLGLSPILPDETDTVVELTVKG